jgi:hypothetical protein
MIQVTGIQGRKVYRCLAADGEPRDVTDYEKALDDYILSPMDSLDETLAVKTLATFFVANTDEEAAIDMAKYDTKTGED